MEKNRRTYSKEFKKRTVKLYLKGGNTQKQIAEDLGIDRSLLSSWCRAYGNKNAFPGHGNPQNERLYRVRRELHDVKIDARGLYVMHSEKPLGRDMRLKG